MGDNRLGRLPKTMRWRQVVALLDASPEDTGAVAGAVVQAAEQRLRELANDPALAEAFRVLTRLTWASRGPTFLNELRALGIDAREGTSALSVIAELGDRIRAESAADRPEGYFREVAALALRSALTGTVGQQGLSLFGSSVEDLRRAFRVYSTRERFGELARRFFSDFMSRSMRSFVDRELANHIGPAAHLATVSDSQEFLAALQTHTWQSALIVEEFAGGWHSKRNWETGGDVSVDDSQRFVAVALRKLRSELRAGAT
ncbi:MAG: hypothetical protein HY874_09515 [Chloroflexi bacterium]|nr:hypothetical protein [Chloroflexota bacterium]